MSDTPKRGRPKVLTGGFTVRLEPAAEEQLRQMAKRENRTPAQMTRILIGEALATRESASKGQT